MTSEAIADAFRPREAGMAAAEKRRIGIRMTIAESSRTSDTAKEDRSVQSFYSGLTGRRQTVRSSLTLNPSAVVSKVGSIMHQRDGLQQVEN